MTEFQPPRARPYLSAARTILNRIQWDIDPRASRSRRELSRLQDKHSGQKAVILCNGPSLSNVDFDLLDGVFTFGLNKINLLFDRSNFRPSSIVSVNPLVIEQNRTFFNSTNIPLFIDWNSAKHLKSREGVIFLNSAAPRGFSYDCVTWVDQGYTVTFVALQLAAYMGFRDVALVGCDHSFATKGTPNSTVSSGQVDQNHFDPRYFAGGVPWQLPDLAQSEVSYLMAKTAFEILGGRIVNCTDGGKLDLFERCTLSSFLAD